MDFIRRIRFDLYAQRPEFLEAQKWELSLGKIENKRKKKKLKEKKKEKKNIFIVTLLCYLKRRSLLQLHFWEK